MATGPGSDDERKRPLDALGKRLGEIRRSREAAARPKGTRISGAGGAAVGFRIAVEILAALAVGLGLGLVVDRWLGSAPAGIIVGCLLGGAAAFVNVMRTARELDRRAKAEREARARSNNGM